jgi:hypothetical protein
VCIDDDRARLADRFAIAGTVATTSLAFGAKVEMMDEYVQCLEDVGAIALRGYQNETHPEVFGILTIVNQQRLTSGRNLTLCAAEAATAFIQDEPEIRPCYGIIQHTEDGLDGTTNYHIMFAGTSPDYCRMMCDALSGHDIACSSWEE